MRHGCLNAAFQPLPMKTGATLQYNAMFPCFLLPSQTARELQKSGASETEKEPEDGFASDGVLSFSFDPSQIETEVQHMKDQVGVATNSRFLSAFKVVYRLQMLNDLFV